MKIENTPTHHRREHNVPGTIQASFLAKLKATRSKPGQKRYRHSVLKTLFDLRYITKMPYPSGFFKYLQNYLLNWLEIFEVWLSNCLKAVLKKLMKIGVRKALNHALSWMTSYRKKSPQNFFLFFSIIFHFFSFPCCVC